MMRVMWFAAIAACGGVAAPPAQPVAPPVAIVADAAVAEAASLDQDPARLVARLLAMHQDVAAALAASGNDCAAATLRLDQLAASYREVVAARVRLVRDGQTERLRAALAPQATAFDAAARAVIAAPALAKCAADPGFTRAYDAMLQPPG